MRSDTFVMNNHQNRQGLHSAKSSQGEKPDRFARARQHMLTRDLSGRDITDARILKVMGEIQRQEFVPQAYQAQAYDDGPLPIGLGQTISQPYIVALMTQQLHLAHDCEVLEIGTGSGYQTAVLSRLVKKVYTVERFAQLSESAQEILRRLGITNVEFYIGDGSCGWLHDRLFDRIMITASVPNVPQPLIDQLVEGGFIVAPVGYGGVQQLIAFEKKGQRLIEKMICGCRFVKLLGKYAFDETD
ncbi:MAG: protein-L-isoaspartate(D-aspartate) O-methyltransferase, partial [Planctomycetota bacterium]